MSDLAAGVINIGSTVKDVIYQDAAVIPVPDQGSLTGSDILSGVAGAGLIEGRPALPGPEPPPLKPPIKLPPDHRPPRSRPPRGEP